MFTATSARPKRRLAAVAATVVAAGSLSLIGLGPANAATVTINKTFAYNCAVSVEGASIGTYAVNVQSQASVPSPLFAGGTVPATPTTITLHMPEDLRATTVTLGGTTVDGSSSDSKIGFTLTGRAQQNVLVQGLSVTGAPIPQTAGADWAIPTKGTVPAVAVPSGTAGLGLTLQQPKTFTADATINTSSGGSLPTTMSCTMKSGVSPQLLAAAIPVANKSASKVTVSAANGTYGKGEKVSYTVAGVAKGSVKVMLGTKTLATGQVASGKGSVTLKGTALAPGSHTLVVKYAGVSGSGTGSASKKVTVAKAKPSFAVAKVTTSPLHVGKTVPKVSVQLKATGVTPSGKVTVTLSGKSVGSASLKSGKATVTLKKFTSKGKKTLTVKYAGSGTVLSASKTVTVTVVT